ENGERLLAEQRVESTGAESYVRFHPLGVILAVMPWNFPFWQAFRAGLPALTAGNVMLLKHSSNVPQSALAIEEVFREAGVPAGGQRVGGDGYCFRPTVLTNVRPGMPV